MAFTDEQRRAFRNALASRRVSDNVADAIISMIESGANPSAGNVAAIGSTTDLVGVDGTGSNAAPLVETEGRLDVIEAKVDELIAALVAAGLMDAP